jgi:phosphatidate cytidylyltransferase
MDSLSKAAAIAFWAPKKGPKDEWLDWPALSLLSVVLAALAIATLVCVILRRRPDAAINPALLEKFNSRVRAWWLMCTILVACFLLSNTVTVILFGCVSFWALREFVTMTPTRRGDHRALFWTFFLFTPLQYVFVGLGAKYYGVYSIMIPVYASLIIPARIAMAGDPKRFLERTAKVQAGLLICVYSLSYAPALLYLPLRETGAKQPWTGSPAGLLFYFVLVVQLNDVFQYAWGRLGKRVIAPDINASRTWEGLLGGLATTTLVGSMLWWATPFRIWEAAGMSLAIGVMGFAGGMVMSAIKRDRGVEDYGTLVQGHAGLLDRIDSICFAAPIFFHLTRHFFSSA